MAGSVTIEQSVNFKKGIALVDYLKAYKVWSLIEKYPCHCSDHPPLMPIDLGDGIIEYMPEYDFKVCDRENAWRDYVIARERYFRYLYPPPRKEKKDGSGDTKRSKTPKVSH